MQNTVQNIMQNTIIAAPVTKMTTNPSRNLTDTIIELIDSLSSQHNLTASATIVDDQVMFHMLHVRQRVIH